MRARLKGWDRHQWERTFWLLMIVPTLLWLKDSVLWVALMSLYANWKTADGAHEAKEAQGSEDPVCEHCDHCKSKA